MYDLADAVFFSFVNIEKIIVNDFWMVLKIIYDKPLQAFKNVTVNSIFCMWDGSDEQALLEADIKLEDNGLLTL